MKRLFYSLLLFSLPVIATAAEKPPPPPPAVGVTVSPVAGGRRIDAVLPGNLIAVALPKGDGGRPRIVALTAPPSPQASPEDDDTSEGPRSLYLIDPAKSGPPWLLREGLPAEANALAAVDLDGDGSDEILVGEPGKIHSVGTPDSPAAPHLLLDEPGLDLRWSTGTSAGTEAGFEATAVGRFRTWAADGSGRLTPGVELDLPVKAGREATGLWLWTPSVTFIPRRDGSPVWTVGPDTQGNVRLRTLLLEPRPDGTTQRTESWSRLPSPETAGASWYQPLDGRPALFVLTFRADEMGLFEKAKLRVFRLGADRSRSGSGPVLAAQTVCHRWQPVRPLVFDLDRDGNDDVVLAQPEGLGGGDMVVEAWFGRRDGRFESSSRKTFLNELEARSWSFGDDVTGDGRPDLLAVQKGQLVIFAGTDNPRQDPLDRRPRHTVEIPGGARMMTEVFIGSEGAGARTFGPSAQLTAPRVQDLDGDGRPEILLLNPSDQGRGRVTVVDLTP